MRHSLLCLIVILCCQLISTGAKSQIPKNEIALEDVSCNKVFSSRSIPRQYRPGANNGIREIPDRQALTNLINK